MTINVTSDVDIPNSYHETMNSTDQWKLAMDDEMDSLISNDTFTLVPFPENCTPVGGRWVYSIKDGPKNTSGPLVLRLK